MYAFTSFTPQLQRLLMLIVHCDEWHIKWLNTLSYLENCGARKIAACEHPTLVKEEMLKHAAEEFRHAHHLKRQIEKIASRSMETYALPYLLGGIATLHYLTALDLKVSCYLKALGFSKEAMKEAAYLLVTYAIELRAAELYPLYDDALRQVGSRVVVKCIWLEEKEHLKEMQKGLKQLPSGFIHAEYACALESQLCKAWLHAVENSVC